MTGGEARIAGEIESRGGVRNNLADDALLEPAEVKAVDGTLSQSQRLAGFPTQTETRGEPRRQFPNILCVTKSVRLTIAP